MRRLAALTRPPSEPRAAGPARPSVRVGGALAASVLLMACGGAATRTAPPPDRVAGARTLLDVVPESHSSFSFMNFAAVRDTRLYGTMDETLGAWADSLERISSADASDALGPAALFGGGPFDGNRPPSAREEADDEAADAEEEGSPELWAIMSHSDWVFVASDPRTEPPRTVTFFGASFTPEEAQTVVTTAAGDRADLPMEDMPLPFGMGAEPPSDPLDLGIAEEGPIEATPVRVYGRDGYEALEFRVVEVAPALWVLGQAEEVATVLERWDRGARRDREAAPRLRDRAGLFEHHAAFVVEDADQLRDIFAPEPVETPGVREVLEEVGGDAADEASEPPARMALPPWLEDVTAAALTVDFASGLRFGAQLETASPRDARQTSRALQRALRGDARHSRFVALFGMREMVERVETARDGDHVQLGVELDELEAHGLWGRLSGTVSALLVAAEAVTGVIEDATGEAPLVEMPETPIEGAQLESTIEVDRTVDGTQTGAGVAGGQTDGTTLGAGCEGRLGDRFHMLRVVEPQRVRVLLRARAPLVAAVALESGGWRCSVLPEGSGVALEATLPPGLHRLYVGTPSGEPTAYVVAATQDESLSADALPRP